MMAIAFVLSAAMLAYEIVLTRIASVLLTNKYTFLVPGMATLGISAVAVCEYTVAGRQTHQSLARIMYNPCQRWPHGYPSPWVATEQAEMSVFKDR